MTEFIRKCAILPPLEPVFHRNSPQKGQFGGKPGFCTLSDSDPEPCGADFKPCNPDFASCKNGWSAPSSFSGFCNFYSENFPTKIVFFSDSSNLFFIFFLTAKRPLLIS